MKNQEVTGGRKLPRKFIISALIGGIAGYYGADLFFDRMDLAVYSDTHLILGAVGLAYLAMGLIVGIGTMAPQTGAKLLNVEDREELLDQKPSLLGGALVYIVMGVMMIVLANSGESRPVPSSIALIVVAIAIIVAFGVTWASWQHYDELMRQISHEASSFGFTLVIVAVLIWGAMAMNGMAPEFDAPSIIALVMGMLLLGAFMAAGRRGLLNPR